MTVSSKVRRQKTEFGFTYFTLQKKEVFGQFNPLEKCFKICYIYGKRKPI